MGLSLPFRNSYFRAQNPHTSGFLEALLELSGFLLLFPFVFLDLMM